MSALQPDKPLLDAWYLVTPGGQSSVRITDGLTFMEEETAQGRQLALALSRIEEGLIRFQVDAFGVWLSVCNIGWQLTGAQGVISGPIPIFHPVDLHFRRTVVHLRTDFSKVDCRRAVQLTLERGERTEQPLSLSTVQHLQSQVVASQRSREASDRAVQAIAAEKKSEEKAPPSQKAVQSPSASEAIMPPGPEAIISPLKEPRVRKIPGEGKPSSLRLAPEPAARDKVPLLTERVHAVRSPESEPASPERTEKSGIPPEEPAIAPVVFNPLVTEAPTYLKRKDLKQKDLKRKDERTRKRTPETKPKRRISCRLTLFVLGLLMVSIEVPVARFLVTESVRDSAGPGARLEGPETLSILPSSVEVQITSHPEQDRNAVASLEAASSTEKVMPDGSDFAGSTHPSP